MFAASSILSQKWPELKAKTAGIAAPLSYVECTALSEHVIDDGCRIAYSAFVSIGDAIQGIENGYYSWPTVKLYYSLFYTIRSLLAFNKIAIFYVGTSPYWIHIKPGERPQPGNSTSSHKVVMSVFQKEFSGSHLLSQTIDNKNPLKWMQDQRELVNYKQAKFIEPYIPSVFANIAKYKNMRKLLSAYMSDDLYAFDPDHAILAYPITVLKTLKGQRKNIDLFDESDVTALQRMLFDSIGPLAHFDVIMK